MKKNFMDLPDSERREFLEELFDLASYVSILSEQIDDNSSSDFRTARKDKVSTISIKQTPLDMPFENRRENVPSCSHEWVNYQGFNESYQFCEKCDTKRTKSK